MDGACREELLGVAGAAAVVVAAVWVGAVAGAWLAGEQLGIGYSSAWRATVSLPSHIGDPARAWPEPARSSLPGPGVYWAATGVCVAAVVAAGVGVALGVVRLRRMPRVRLGVEVRARFALPRDLVPLAVSGPTTGRLILGRVAGRLVATEDRSRTTLRSRRARARQGDRTPVAVIGSTRSGKTAGVVIPGVLEWDGPAVVVSVKGDILRESEHARARRGRGAGVRPDRPHRSGYVQMVAAAGR